MITHSVAKQRRLILSLFFGSFLALSAFAQDPPDPVAPDGTPRGPLATTRADYKFPAAVMPEVIPDRATELWARVYWPRDLSGGPFPLVIFLHGNHGTCGMGHAPRVDNGTMYTTTGTCVAPFPIVTPNHLGYAYMANRLASWGYIVVSINANRGITAGAPFPGDGGLNLARGRLILKHMQQLSRWNQGLDPLPASLGLPANGLVGKLDFNNVGLMGHSRGGEGARAAYFMYFNDPNFNWQLAIGVVNFDGIFEIGPVDGQTSLVLNSNDTKWNVLLPMCDGDVSNLQGIKPFDRMMVAQTELNQTQKSSYTVWGTNHNFYNTEWQQSDSGGCSGTHPPIFGPTNGSVPQRRMSRASLLPFFRANMPAFGSDTSFNQNFDPEFILPAVTRNTTRVDRGYTDTPDTTAFEDFAADPGNCTVSQYGFPITTAGLGGGSCTTGSVPEHDPSLKAAIISWTVPNGFLRTEWTAPGIGTDISAFKTLDFRVSRQVSGLNPAGPTNLSVQLVQANGALSTKAQLKTYSDLSGPVSGPFANPHRILQTVRIPLSAFSGVALTQIQALQVNFDDTPSGAIYLSNFRLSLFTLLTTPFTSEEQPNLLEASFSPVNLSIPIQEGTRNMIGDIRSVSSAAVLGNQPGVEIEVTSDTPFPVRNELVVLCIGRQQFTLGRYPEDGDTHTLIFTLTPEEFAQISAGDPVWVQYGRGEAFERWDFGSLNKDLVHKTD